MILKKKALRGQICFNSKMVRFKAVITSLSCLPYEGFNSKMVRFKDENSQLRQQLRLRSFNSKMVRFKVFLKLYYKHLFTVSIPKWCDLKYIMCNFFFAFFLVSIPKWCDLKVKKICLKQGIILSFNSKMVRFKDFSCQNQKLRVISFQFQNGAI